jgi:hypothetical protein
MTIDGAPQLLTSETPTSPHLSRLVWLGEQLQQTAGELAELFRHDGVLRDLTGAEFDALRQAAAAARTAGGDVVLVATAAHHRAAAAQ